MNIRLIYRRYLFRDEAVELHVADEYFIAIMIQKTN